MYMYMYYCYLVEQIKTSTPFKINEFSHVWSVKMSVLFQGIIEMVTEFSIHFNEADDMTN